MWDGGEDCYRELVPWGFCQIWSGGGHLAGREGSGMGGVSGDSVRVACKHPQSAYSGLQKYLQQ